MGTQLLSHTPNCSLREIPFSVVTKKLTPEQITKLNIDPTSLPKHVSVIMDGNGRWAQERSLPRTDGHLQGEEALLNASKQQLN